jgi:broad specificity phosphatase PhoE
MDHTVYFVRHGQTDWNAEGRLQGQTDTDLNETGRAQASSNGALLARLIDNPAGFDFVASPLRRTRQTMERIRLAMGLAPQGYRTDARLLELSFGDWEGHTFAELEAVDDGCFARRELDKWGFVPPGAKAESYQMLADRVAPLFAQIDRDTICVAHGGILRAALQLTGTLSPVQAAAFMIPQDKVLRWCNDRLEWLGGDYS